VNPSSASPAAPRAPGLLSRPVLGLSTEAKADLLDGMPWAAEFTFAQLQKLAACMEAYRVPGETVLFFEGDREPYFVLIVEGRVHVAKLDPRRKPRRIATLGPGKTLGEMIIVDGEPRSASALTEGPATLLVMTGEHYGRLVEETPRVAVILLAKIARLMSQHLRQTSGRLMDHLGAG
jgi:CRP/FNR family transcriptional regulator, cyclic AMP receptor protein